MQNDRFASRQGQTRRGRLVFFGTLVLGLTVACGSENDFGQVPVPIDGNGGTVTGSGGGGDGRGAPPAEPSTALPTGNASTGGAATSLGGAGSDATLTGAPASGTGGSPAGAAPAVGNATGGGPVPASEEGTGGEGTGGEVTGGEGTGGEGTGGDDTGSEGTGGEGTGGEGTGGEATGGEATGGEATGGEATGGEATGGESSGENDDAAQLCVDTINEYRASIDVPPLARWTDGEACADGQAQSDSETGQAHGAYGECSERGQDECPGWPAPPENMIEDCLAMMWAEGPGGGHYDTMANTGFTEVACGFYVIPGTNTLWALQDFR